MERKWNVPARVMAEQAAAFSGLDPLLVQLLSNRGVTNRDEALRFLAADESLTHDVKLLDEVDAAVERLLRALVMEERIAVYGDFDADGITSTVLLTQALRSLGATVTPYIPHRIDEGYGLNRRALATLREQGVGLVVTVDCGISSDEEIAFARTLGLDVIVTDHHAVTGPWPDAVAAINPKRPGSRYPFSGLAGVGVAFKLAQALLSVSGESRACQETDLLDLVAIGTVADLAPLVDENRYLVRRGLEILNSRLRPGLHEIALRAGLRLGSIDASSIGYALGPRLNAAGRLDDAIISYNLLSALSTEEAGDAAGLLEAQNQERQRLTNECLLRAKEEARPLADEAPLLIISGEGYPQGIVGLVAGRLVDEFYRPVLVIEEGEEECRGSARSIPEFNMIAALEQCRDLLVRFGGHAQAAGFTVRADKLAEFRGRLAEIAERELGSQELCPSLEVDAEVSLQQLSWDTVHLIQQLAPFGYGNPSPTFMSRGVKLQDWRVVGNQNNHLRLRLHDGRTVWPAIAFRQAAAIERPASHLDVVFSLEVNDWRDNRTLQLRILDLRPSV